MTETTPPAWHYKLEAYVGPNRSIPPSFSGWASFATILTRRPRDCRYAVVQVVDVFDKDVDGRFYVWDFDAPAPWGQRPPVKWIEATADAAIMKAIALYGQD